MKIYKILEQILKNQTVIMSALVGIIESEDFNEENKKFVKDSIYTLTLRTGELLGVDMKGK